jgi:hypothetical protein
MGEPQTRAERARKRADIRRRWVAEGERKAIEYSRSMKCSGWGMQHEPRHAGTEDGCAGGWANCLCECHDPQGGAS